MIKYFNTGYISRYALVIFFGIIIWLPSFIIPESYSGVTSYAYNVISDLFGTNNFVLTIVSFLLTIATAFLLNSYAIRTGIIGKVSTIVFMLYVLLSSSLTPGFHNNPIIWINFILVFVWANLMQLPYSKNTIPIIFNASFLTGVASLFNSQLIFLLALIWMAVFIHRIVTWRNLLIPIIGVGLPYFFMLVWFYFRELLLEESYELFNPLKIDLSLVYPLDYLNIFIAVTLVILGIVTVFGTMGILSENSINTRRNLLITVVYFFTAVIILSVFTSSLVNMLLLTVPFVLILSYWFSHVRKPKWFNIILGVLMLLIFLNQYVQLAYSLLEI